jgi:uncharacterized cupredoxin-like copper-binding protein
MMRTSTRRVLGVLAAVLLVAAGCGDDDDDTSDPGGEAVTVGAIDYAFTDLPAELEAGTFEFTLANEGKVDHEIALVEIGDTDVEQFFIDFGPVIEEGAAFPDYVGDLVGAVEVPPSESGSFVFTLTEGSYIAFCALTGDADNPESEEDGAPHFAEGMQQPVTVTAGQTAVLPDSDGSITASDYTFDVDIDAGDTVINFANDGPNDHFAGIDVYPEGTTVEDAEAGFATLLQTEEGQEPPAGTPMGEELAFSGIASDGLGVQFTMPEAFESGRTYLLYCFLQDRTGGPPHAIGNQMFKAFTVE